MSLNPSAIQQISDLVERFQALSVEDRALYGNEQQLCDDYLIPLFRALGWRTDNTPEMQVLTQQRVGRKRLDYEFRLDGVARFVLEAKSADQDVHRVDFAKQAISYAYGRGVRWAVLSNFTELLVFNASVETEPNTARYVHLTAEEFFEHPDRLWLLTPDAFREGALDQHARSVGVASPRVPAETRLFELLQGWRRDLVSNLRSYNQDLSLASIDDLVQTLLNRLVFIRTVEDRYIEDPRLRAALNLWDSGQIGSLLSEVRQIFRHYAGIYDSDIFPDPDASGWESTFIDEPTLAAIVRGLYAPPDYGVEFDFSAIGADVLGRIYEQYLGFELLPSKRRAAQLRSDGMDEFDAVLAERREFKHSQGIYYTPRYIVDYIVRHTVAEALYEDEIPPHLLTVADITCGSGSFLLGAYGELLDALDFEANQNERLELLRSSIFGVDLDPHAVQIAKLNLLIRALADSTRLPLLDTNVVFGNSVIHGGSEHLREFFGDDWTNKQPLDFHSTFPHVMDAGGFDVIIGNPPYVRVQELDRAEANYFRSSYQVSGSFDLYLVCIERALELLRPGGRLGMIVPSKFAKNEYGKGLRTLIADHGALERFIHLGDAQVFGDATNYTSLLFLRKERRRNSFLLGKIGSVNTTEDIAEAVTSLDMPPASVDDPASIEELESPTGDAPWLLLTGVDRRLHQRLTQDYPSLGSISTNVFQGLITSADYIYHLRGRRLRDGRMQFRRFKKRRGGQAVSSTEPWRELEPEVMKPLLSGPDVDRYCRKESNLYLLFPYSVEEGRGSLIPAEEFESRFPNAWEYLTSFEEELRSRERGKMDREGWYAFGRNQNLGLHDFPKLAVPATISRLECWYDASGDYYLNNVRLGGVLLSQPTDAKYEWVTGLLNSRLLDWVFRRTSTEFQHGYFQANRQFIEPLPIFPFDDGDSRCLEVVNLARDLARIRADIEDCPEYEVGRRRSLRAQFTDADARLDDLIFDLYKLSSRERQVVEEDAQ